MEKKLSLEKRKMGRRRGEEKEQVNRWWLKKN
jgi:hypothetical protein